MNGREIRFAFWKNGRCAGNGGLEAVNVYREMKKRGLVCIPVCVLLTDGVLFKGEAKQTTSAPDSDNMDRHG